MNHPNRWYGDGLRFDCTQCGNCCTGAPGHVWVTDQEEQRIAARLQMSLESFQRRYVRQVQDRRSLIEKPGGDCIFLTEEKLCGIHEDKPRQCVIFPFWPGVLLSPRTWNEAAQRCPGMGSGPVYTPEEVETITRSTTTTEQARALMEAKKP